MPVLGIDIGTQSLKAVVLDDALSLLGAGDRQYRPSYPRPGWAEEDPRLWLDALGPAVAAALERAGLEAGDIKAVAICGQLDGCVAADVAGKALAPAIIWMDRRASAEIAGIDGAMIHKRCGLVLDASHMAAKIAWQARHLETAAQVATWHQPVSFVVEALTGVRAISHSLASTTMLYGLSPRRWDDELLAAFGIAEDALPPIFDETDIVGTVSGAGAALSGLKAGTPVVTGTGDDFSNPLGCGVHTPGVVAVSLGTGETVAALSRTASIDPGLMVETHAYPGGLFHLGNPGWLSGGAVRWAQGLLSVGTDAEFSVLAGEAPPGCDGLTFLPALTGAMAPKWIAGARGSFIGLTPSHGRAHLARAVLEGTAFAMRDVIARLDELAVDTTRLRLMGGGTRSVLWCQIRADAVQCPTEVVAEADASAIGAGLLALMGAGLFADIATAVGALPLDLRPVAPNARMAPVYDDAYALYRTRFAALEPTWPAA